jgi:hypothetical protein
MILTRQSLRYVIAAIFAVALILGCETEKHGRLKIVSAKVGITILDQEATKGWRTVERTHSLYRIFDVFDTTGRRSDHVWVNGGFLHDWNRYKSIVIGDGKAIVLHERLSLGTPFKGQLWPEFFVSTKDGEVPEVDTRASNRFPVLSSHLLYLFEPMGLLWADYNSKGELDRIAASDQSGSTYFHVSLAQAWGASNAFAAYQIPPRFDARHGVPPVNRVFTNGLAAIASSKFPTGRLVGCFALNRSRRLDLMELRSFSPIGQPLGSTLLRYRARPYDKELAEWYLKKPSPIVALPSPL